MPLKFILKCSTPILTFCFSIYWTPKIYIYLCCNSLSSLVTLAVSERKIMKNKNALTAAFASCLLGDYRVVTRYMGSGINRKRWGGIRDHSAGIWDHKPWDRDQHYCKGIRDPVFRHKNKDHKILKCALIGGTCQHFSIQLYFCCNISIRY